MFPKFLPVFFIIISILFNIILFSCASFSTEKEEPEPEAPPAAAVDETSSTEAESPSEKPTEEILPDLMWSDPEPVVLSLQPGESCLPEVVFREISPPAVSGESASNEVVFDNAVPEQRVTSEDARSPSTEKDNPRVAEVPKKSFLELLFEPSSRRAEVREDVTEEAEAEPDLRSDNDDVAENNIQDEPATPVETVSAEAEPVESPDVEPNAIAEEVNAEAALREVFVFECEGEGWILENFTDSEGLTTDRLRYSGREYMYGNTVFSFYPYEIGEFIINLRKTDYSTNKTEQTRLYLEVKNVLDEAVASAAEELPTEPSADEAETTAEDISAETDEQKIPGAGDVADAAEKLKNAGDCRGAAALLESGMDEVEWNERDLLYYRLAGLYESCPGIRDERLAVKNYKKIVDNYPVSNYWLESKERIIYLERNFIYIR